jgi:hypothetical protein
LPHHPGMVSATADAGRLKRACGRRRPGTIPVPAISPGHEYNGGDPKRETDHHPEYIEFHKHARYLAFSIYPQSKYPPSDTVAYVRVEANENMHAI